MRKKLAYVSHKEETMNNSLSAKELMYLEDMMNMEAAEIVKCRQAAQSAIDPQAKSLLNSAAQQHQSHFNLFHQHLQNASGS